MTSSPTYPTATSMNNTAHIPVPSTSKTQISSAASSPSPSPSPSSSLPEPPNGSGGDELIPIVPLIKAVFPIGQGSQSWTTAQGAGDELPISDATFRPTNNMRSLSHNTVTSPGPNPKPAIEAIFPAGSWTFGHGNDGGFSFYAPGPEEVDLTIAKEATFGYSVMFEEGWEWNRGGKLPGFYGGDNEEVAMTCSGGRHDEGCWSARLMWRREGAGEMYTYLPPNFEENKVLCDLPPFSTCNPTYGTSVSRGSFHFKAGDWTTVSQRVRLNDPGQANGELELFVDGTSVINASGLVLRDSHDGRIRGIEMQTFFGGSTSDWASPKDQKAYFSDFSVAITDML
ncbi:hypothetical protein B0F90DRAFT_1710040 [Multifurca ochricompacta]|uniref:Polysaccharide lyase 14 domain-containing protein n=1 Tax=Multifurca ochricompacta TaxID=376703 RepID=A0AAD4QPL1_9AGAM|nr:hypothetical protein B0F90DRAFT_1710040 [Multifurca ochricompacta]